MKRANLYGRMNGEQTPRVILTWDKANETVTYLDGDGQARNTPTGTIDSVALGMREAPERKIGDKPARIPEGPQTTRIDEFWVITRPTRESTLGDVLFKSTIEAMALQFDGGLKADDIVGIYTNGLEASEIAIRLVTRASNVYTCPGCHDEFEGHELTGKTWAPCPRCGTAIHGLAEPGHLPRNARPDLLVYPGDRSPLSAEDDRKAESTRRYND